MRQKWNMGYPEYPEKNKRHLSMIIASEIQQLPQAAASLATSLGLILTVGGLFIACRSYTTDRERERLEKAYGA